MGFGGFFGIFHHNLLMQLKQVRRNILLILMPVVIFFFVYLFFSVNEVAGDFVSPIKMAVIDEDHTTYSDMLVQSFRNNESFSQFVEVVEGDRDQLAGLFESRSIDVLIRVPEGFIESLATSDAKPLDVRIQYDDPVKAILFKNVITSYEKYIRSVETAVILIDDELRTLDIDREIRYSYRDRSLVNLIFVALARNEFFETSPIINVPSVSAVKYYFIALMVMFLMYISIFAAINLIRERQDMCLHRLATTRVNMVAFIGAKACAITVYILMIVVIWFLAYGIFYGALWEGNLLWLLLFLVVSIFFNVSLAMFFTVFFENEASVVLLSSIFIFFNAVIGGSIIPIHNMPYLIQRLARIAPNYWMIRGFLFIDHSYQLFQIFIIGLILIGISLVLILLTGLRQRNGVTR